MKVAKLALALALCLFLVCQLSASGRTSVFAVIEKVVFEPNEANADRIQLWGAFAFVDGGGAVMSLAESVKARQAAGSGATAMTSSPLRGYMYFSLPSTASVEQIKVVRTEWSDLKKLTGTGEAVAFGQWMYMGVFTQGGPTSGVYASVQVDERSYRGIPVAVLDEVPPTYEPIPYLTNMGLMKLSADGSHAEIVKKLRAALAQGATR